MASTALPFLLLFVANHYPANDERGGDDDEGKERNEHDSCHVQFAIHFTVIVGEHDDRPHVGFASARTLPYLVCFLAEPLNIFNELLKRTKGTLNSKDFHLY